MPVGLNLREHGLVGLVGGEGKQGAYEVAREILIQAAYGCSYTEVKLVLLYDASNPDEKAMFSLFRWAAPYVVRGWTATICGGKGSGSIRGCLCAGAGAACKDGANKVGII